MIGKINTVTKGLRRFRASSVGEFVIAVALSIALGTLMVVLVISAMPVAAFGQDATWRGGVIDGSPSDWNNGLNWSTGTVPGATNTAFFTNSEILRRRFQQVLRTKPSSSLRARAPSRFEPAQIRLDFKVPES